MTQPLFPPPAATLNTQADVEQKVIWPLLTILKPHGLGIPIPSIFVKTDIRRLKIGKGESSKLYYPDYAISISGIPLLLVEAKAPDVDLLEASREIRLYATETNANYPSNVNPCRYCVVSNGLKTELRAWDSNEVIASFTLQLASPASANFADFIDRLGFSVLSSEAAKIHKKARLERFERPVNLVGGTSMRDDRIEFNDFGRLLISKFQNLFNPNTWQDRQRIVNNAYVPSRRRERYIDEIDHIIKAAAPPLMREAKLIEDTSHPAEITERFLAAQELKNKILLLIGVVGSGKSTFVDFLQEVALFGLKDTLAWVRLDLNEAPISAEEIYKWCRNQLILSIRNTSPDLDIVSIAGLRKLYKAQISDFDAGVGTLFPRGSDEYNKRLADLLTTLQNAPEATLKALERHLCTGRGRLLVVGLDNCDKRNRDEQLLMFQVAKWIQQEIRCLIILPLRQETFANHRNEPPLDTALQDLIFQIQAPPFQEVLSQRLKLVMAEARQTSTKNLGYHFGTAHVTFNVDNLERFLKKMMASLFANKRYGRNIIIGLAGWNIRRAFEIFLDFCRSGYIDESDIFKSQATGEQQEFSSSVIARVLLRTNRRYYDGDQSYVKNLFQCNPQESKADHFIRYRTLIWLRKHSKEKGDSGLRGFHRLFRVVHALVAAGSDELAARQQINYLLREGCILSEHLKSQLASDEDLIAITPAGHVHLELAHYDAHYLAACAEDCWLADRDLVNEIHRRITLQPLHNALGWGVTLDTARDFAAYLKSQQQPSPSTPLFLSDEKREAIDIEIGPILKAIYENIYRHDHNMQSRRR